MIYMSLAITNNNNAKVQAGLYESALQKKGYEVFNPVKHFANSELTEKQIMTKELEILSDCSMMVILPNSYKSKGVKIEIAWCEKFNIPIKRVLYGKHNLVLTAFEQNTYNVSEQIENWIKSISDSFDLSLNDYLLTRSGDVVMSRHVIAYILKAKGLSYNTIGKLLFKDRATILHSVKIINNYVVYHKETQLLIDKFLDSYHSMCEFIKEVA